MPELIGRRLSELPFVTQPIGSEVYAEKHGESVRIKVGDPNGLTTLDSEGKIPAEQLPPIDTALRSDLESADSGKGAALIGYDEDETVHDRLNSIGQIRADLASSADGLGAGLVAYRDPVAPAYLKTTSDINNGLAVSVLRAIPASQHASVFAGTATADFSAGINNILVDMGTAGRGHLVHEGGTITIGSPIIIPADIRFSGGGFKSRIVPIASMQALVRMLGNYTRAEGLTLQNASGFASRGFDIANVDNVHLHDNHLFDFVYAIYNDAGQGHTITRNFTLNNDYCIYSPEDLRNTIIDSNFLWGGTGISLNRTSQQPEGVRITNNTILPTLRTNPASGNGIEITAGMEIFIGNNIVDNVDKIGLLLAAGTAGPISLIKSVGNWYGNDGGEANAEGVLAYGNINDLLFMGDTFCAAKLYGMHIGIAGQPAVNNVTVQNCKFLSNVGDLRIELGTNLRIKGNSFTAASNAYREESNSVTARVSENIFSGGLPAPRSTGSRFWRNQGFITENKGAAAVGGGFTTSGQQAHGLSVTPQAKDFSVVLQNTPTNDIGTYSIQNITATHFELVTRADPGSSGLFFSWSVNADGS